MEESTTIHEKTKEIGEVYFLTSSYFRGKALMPTTADHAECKVIYYHQDRKPGRILGGAADLTPWP